MANDLHAVVWKPLVKQKLADIWMEAPDRVAVSAAANEIDRMLKAEPLTHGESRQGAERILIVSPLAVVYEIADADRRVDVLAVRHVPTRPKRNN